MPTRSRDGELLGRTFTVRVAELRAVMLFASTDDTRFVLNGIHIEVRPGRHNHPLLIATDGRRLACLETVSEQEPLPETSFELTLGTHFLKPLCGFAKSQATELQFEFRPPHRILCRFVGGNIFIDSEDGAVIEGTFPNWRAVVPAGERQLVQAIGLNAEYMGDFAKAAKLLDVETPIISVNLIGTSSAMDIRIEARPQFYGVLMPAKFDQEKEFQPEFIGFGPEPKPEPAQEPATEGA